MKQRADALVHVLVVEDETVIGMFIQTELEDAGFVVELTETAAQARCKLRDQRAQFDAAVVDLGLPDDSGERIIEEVRARHPDMPIVVATGISKGAMSPLYATDANLCLLAKPYQASELVQSLVTLVH